MKLTSNQKQEWITLFEKTGKLPETKVPCNKCGTQVTMFSTNLTARIAKFNSISNLLNEFVCKKCKQPARAPKVKSNKIKVKSKSKQQEDVNQYQPIIMVKSPVVIHQFNEIADNKDKVEYVTKDNCPQPHIYLDNGRYCNGCCLFKHCACKLKRLNNKITHPYEV